MKILSVIIHPSNKTELADCLKLSNLNAGFMFSHVEFFGEELDSEKSTNRDLVTGYVPKVRVDIFVKQEKVEELLECLRSINGLSGNSLYWIDETQNLQRL